jgi:hypothetical protein
LGLPSRGPAGGDDTNQGGYFGTESDVAAGIYRAIETWNSRPQNATRHLVINLSLGWECADPSGYPHIRNAIKHAVCAGGVVVAAAGNLSSTSSSGPMCPAAFEQSPAPTPEECKVIEGVKRSGDLIKRFARFTKVAPPPPTAKSAYRPLVYAVGGVDLTDSPLGNSRAKATPRLVAMGSNAVEFPDAVPVAESHLLTGTSISSAVVSAAASVVWSYRPELSAAEVMDIVYGSGRPVEGAVDFCFGGSCASIKPHRVSICSSLSEACKGGKGPCASVAPACEPKPPRSSNAILSQKTIDEHDHPTSPAVAPAPTTLDFVKLFGLWTPSLFALASPQGPVIMCPNCIYHLSTHVIDGLVQTPNNPPPNFNAPYTFTKFDLSTTGIFPTHVLYYPNQTGISPPTNANISYTCVSPAPPSPPGGAWATFSGTPASSGTVFQSVPF